MNKKLHYRRRWLNTPRYHSVALIITRIDKSSHKSKKGKVTWDVDASVAIMDCYRKVDLDFGFGNYSNKADLKNVVYKIDTLLSTLQEFREVLLKEIPSDK